MEGGLCDAVGVEKRNEVMGKVDKLPTKICKVCGKPFTWRKKWEKVWEDVLYCSERCRRNK